MIGFRHADPGYPFLWEDTSQPPARWHGPGEGPVHYFSDTPEGAWAEFIRHEEIRDEEDVATIQRALWAVDVGDEPYEEPKLPTAILTGGIETYPSCQKEARRIRDSGRNSIVAPSAALLPGEARGWRVDGGLQPGPPRDGKVVILFGRRPDLIGWPATVEGHPDKDLLSRVHYL